MLERPLALCFSWLTTPERVPCARVSKQWYAASLSIHAWTGAALHWNQPSELCRYLFSCLPGMQPATLVLGAKSKTMLPIHLISAQTRLQSLLCSFSFLKSDRGFWKPLVSLADITWMKRLQLLQIACGPPVLVDILGIWTRSDRLLARLKWTVAEPDVKSSWQILQSVKRLELSCEQLHVPSMRVLAPVLFRLRVYRASRRLVGEYPHLEDFCITRVIQHQFEVDVLHDALGRGRKPALPVTSVAIASDHGPVLVLAGATRLERLMVRGASIESASWQWAAIPTCAPLRELWMSCDLFCACAADQSVLHSLATRPSGPPIIVLNQADYHAKTGKVSPLVVRFKNVLCVRAWPNIGVCLLDTGPAEDGRIRVAHFFNK